MRKGLIAGLFITGFLTLGATAGFVTAFVWNYEDWTLKDSDGMVVSNNEITLADENNPLYPGEARSYSVDVDVMWSGKTDVNVYFYGIEVSEDAVSVVVSFDNYASPAMPINTYTEEEPLHFEVNLKKGINTFNFAYTVNELSPDVEDVSLTFRNTIRVEKRVGGK